MRERSRDVRKTPFVLALALPPAILCMAAFDAPPEGKKEAPAPRAAAAPADPAPDDPARDNTAFMRLTITQNRNASALDFVVTTDLWHGPKFRGFPGGAPAFLQVEVFPAADADGRGVPVALFKSETFTATKGVRTGARYPYLVPLPPDPRGYLVRVDILGVNPIVQKNKVAPPVRASKRIRLRVG
jgi:hypothetical protein